MISSALLHALEAAELEPRDAATVELAKALALEIDMHPELTDKLAPKLLATLAELLMTPKSRASIVKGAPADDKPNPLEQLRKRRSARRNGTENLDSTAPKTDSGD